jgi:cleavage stimulation factor subunit 3
MDDDDGFDFGGPAVPISAAVAEAARPAEATPEPLVEPPRQLTLPEAFQELIGADADDVDKLWQPAGWAKLIDLASASAEPAFARTIFERCLKLFPSAPKPWLAYLRWERQHGNSDALEGLLSRCLSTSVEPELWLYYIEYLIETKLKLAEELRAASRTRLDSAATALATAGGAAAAVEEKAAAERQLAEAQQAELLARHMVSEATDLAVRTVGDAYHAGPLWDAFLSVHKSAPDATSYEQSQKRDALRRAYHRSIVIPHSHTDRHWREYTAWERAHSPAQLAAGLINNHQTGASTAIAVAGELALLWRGIDRFALPCPPSSAAVARAVPAAECGACAGGIAGAAGSGGIEGGEGASAIASAQAALEALSSHHVSPLEGQMTRWARLRAYQRTNPAMVEAAANAKALRLLYRQSLCAHRYVPELWLEFALWEESSGKKPAGGSSGSGAAGTAATASAGASSAAPAAADGVSGEAAAVSLLHEATTLLPTCVLLVVAAADMLELRKQAPAGRQLFDNLIQGLTALADMHAAAKTVEAAASAKGGAAGGTGAGEDGDWTPAEPPKAFTLEEAWMRLDSFEPALTTPMSVVTALSFPSRAEAAAAALAVPHAFILCQRYARRTAGVDASRAVFAAARKSRYLSPLVYLAAAQGELYANRSLPVARNVLEAGRKRFPRDLPFALSALDFLTLVDEETNVRAAFEAALGDFPPADSRPLYDRYIAYELRHAAGGGSLAAVLSLEAKRAAAHPHLAGPDLPALVQLLHRAVEFGCPPLTRLDLDLLQRQPAGPFATVAAAQEKPEAPAAGSKQPAAGSARAPAPTHPPVAAQVHSSSQALAAAAVSNGLLPVGAGGDAGASGADAGPAGGRHAAHGAARDGLFPQVRSLYSGALSHIAPAAALLAGRAVAEAEAAQAGGVQGGYDDDSAAQRSHRLRQVGVTGSGSAAPALSAVGAAAPSLLGLLQRLPVYDAGAAALLQSAASSSGGVQGASGVDPADRAVEQYLQRIGASPLPDISQLGALQARLGPAGANGGSAESYGGRPGSAGAAGGGFTTAGYGLGGSSQQLPFKRKIGGAAFGVPQAGPGGYGAVPATLGGGAGAGFGYAADGGGPDYAAKRARLQ